jgi:hypothetical protein
MIRLSQQFALTRWMPRDLHAADQFIRPAEMVTALERGGFASKGLTGMKPSANPLRLITLMRSVHLGRLTPEEFGRRTRMVLTPDTSILYIGHAERAETAGRDDRLARTGGQADAGRELLGDRSRAGPASIAGRQFGRERPHPPARMR